MNNKQGFQVMIEMLRASQEKGRNVSGYVQYDTIWRLRSSYVTFYIRLHRQCQTQQFLRIRGVDISSVQSTLWILHPFKSPWLVY